MRRQIVFITHPKQVEEEAKEEIERDIEERLSTEDVEITCILLDEGMKLNDVIALGDSPENDTDLEDLQF